MDVRDAPPALSHHARVRAQARGVPLRIINAIFTYADRGRFVGGGRRSLIVSRRRLGRLADTIPASDRERMEGVTLIISRIGTVIITVFHACRSRGGHYRRRNAEKQDDWQ